MAQFSNFIGIEGPCKIQNGGCSENEKCRLDEYGKVKCECSFGKVFQENGRCIDVDEIRSTCSRDQFLCNSGHCIDYTLTCDNVGLFCNFLNNC